jgi:hypothetical protein
LRGRRNVLKAEAAAMIGKFQREVLEDMREGRRNVTDKEQLELAAKAAGIEHHLLITDDNAPDGYRIWNPLTDDGDALRLAVKLGFSLQCATGLSIVTYEDREARIKQVGEHHNLEPHNKEAATRRAIVRAAAEIGRSMK